MARFDGEGFDELIATMQQDQGLFEKYADDVLLAGAEVVKESWQSAIEQHGLVDTGDMLASVAPGKIETDANGVKNVEVYPQGTDRKGVRNAEKAYVNHYGSSSIKATHFVDDAESNAEEAAVEAMASVWYQKIEEG